VAVSLKERDGFSLEKGQFLWMNHMLDAECYTRGFPRVFHPLNRLVSDTEEAIGLITEKQKIRFAKTDQDVKSKIECFIDPDLIHHRAMKMELREFASELISSFWELLLEATDEGFMPSNEFKRADLKRTRFLKMQAFFLNTWIPQRDSYLAQKEDEYKYRMIHYLLDVNRQIQAQAI